MNINTVSICPKCGKVYTIDSDDFDFCPNDYCGYSLRSFPENDCAAIAKALMDMGYPVRRFKFPNDCDTARRIEIEFGGQCDFTLNPPPDGFTYERGIYAFDGLNVRDDVPDQARYDYGHETPSFVYKRYPADMPPTKYARQLIADKYALIEWIYRHPYMRQLLND